VAIRPAIVLGMPFDIIIDRIPEPLLLWVWTESKDQLNN